MVGRVAGILGVLFVIGHVLVVHLPVVAAVADGIQPEAVNGLFSAKTLLFPEYGGNSRVAGDFNFAEICNRLCISIAYFVCSTDKFIAGVWCKRHRNLFNIIGQCL